MAQEHLHNSPQHDNSLRGMLCVLIIIAISIGGVFLFAKTQSGPELGQVIPDQGREHIAIDAPHAVYNSNPPTSGPHHARAADWGIYDQELPDEQLIHNLEHGGIWISTKDLQTSDLEQLKSIAKSYPQTVILTPRAKNTSPIVVASWKRMMTLDHLDKEELEKIISYVKKYKNQSPEPLVP